MRSNFAENAENGGNMRLYGIKNCDTCRRALRELRAAGREVDVVDVRAGGLPDERIAAFLAAFGERLVNRSSATWRGLPEGERSAAPAALIAAHPGLMKRPVVEDGERLWLGWRDEVRDEIIG